jgi:hypothetical protein
MRGLLKFLWRLQPPHSHAYYAHDTCTYIYIEKSIKNIMQINNITQCNVKMYCMLTLRLVQKNEKKHF